MELSDINLLDQDVFAERVPHEWFRALRDQAPVYHHPEPDGPGFWVFSRHEDVALLNRNWEQLSSDQARGGVVGLAEMTPERKAANDAVTRSGAANMMLTMDPPEHTRYRKLVNRGFTPRVIRSLEDHLREISVKIIERALAKDDGRSDFVVDVAAELPLEAIAEFLGVPYEDRHKLFEWSNNMIGSEDPEYAISESATNQARFEMYMYSNALGADRRLHPRDDIVSKLIHGEVDGEKLSEMDFDLFFLLLAVAGNETTRNALAHGMAALLDNPEAYRAMVDDPSIIERTAIDEVLRWATPVMYFRRNMTEDMEYKGQHIAAGDKVSLWYMSANRDERVFDDPYTFDIHREPNPHVAFGGGGPHHCIGVHLAKMEMKVMFEELVARVPRIDKAGSPARLRSNFVNGIKHLPVQLIPASRPVSIL
ncbi:MAG TPA: cytochrome P450 [Ilumatobacter sp.]|nr:cytochrome P450 [Ilumatobacter sp.]